MITHVVLMKFTDTGDAAEGKARLEALPAQIPDIRSLVVGLDVVRTPASYDLCLTTTHDDTDALKAYQDHPVHREFASWLKPRLTDRVLVDYRD